MYSLADGLLHRQRTARNILSDATGKSMVRRTFYLNCILACLGIRRLWTRTAGAPAHGNMDGRLGSALAGQAESGHVRDELGWQERHHGLINPGPDAIPLRERFCRRHELDRSASRSRYERSSPDGQAGSHLGRRQAGRYRFLPPDYSGHTGTRARPVNGDFPLTRD